MFQLNVRVFNNFSLFLTMTNYFTVSSHTKELWIEHLEQSLVSYFIYHETLIIIKVIKSA